METSVPLQLSQKLARAKSLLRRDAAIRGIEALMTGIESYEPKNLLRKARFEVEVLIQECVTELNRQPDVRRLFTALAHNDKAHVPYSPGHEDKLMAMLRLVHKALTQAEEAEKRAEEEALQARKTALEQKGLGYLKNGDLSRGKAALRILAEEFGHEPGMLVQVATWLMEYRLYFEASEILEMSMEQFPKDNKAYGLATQSYKAMNDLEKVESVYIRAIREFGRHPRTLLNLALVYQNMHKNEEAFHLAQEAWNKDHSLSEAKEIVDKLT